MLIDNERQLRTWLEWRLAPICDADPKALAKYVLALTKKDKSDDDLQSLCIDQLEVFIQGETVKFVSDLFEQLNSKEYIKFDLKAVEEKEKASKQAEIAAVITKKENLEDAGEENKNWMDNNGNGEGLKGYTDDESTTDKVAGKPIINNEMFEDPEQTALDPVTETPNQIKIETKKFEDKPKYKEDKIYRDNKYKEKPREKHRDYSRHSDRDYRHRSRSRSPRDSKYKRDRSRSPKYRRSPERDSDRYNRHRRKDELKKELERQKSAHEREIRELKEKNERYKAERDRKEREQFKRLETQRLIEKEIAIQKAERLERKERKEKQESIKREIALQRQIEVYKLSRARERDRKKDKSLELLKAELKSRERSKSPKKTKKDKSRSRSPSKKACPDFYEKGICTRGDNCKYEHTGAIVTIDNDYALVTGTSNVNSLTTDGLTSPVVQTQVPQTGTVPIPSLTPPVLPNNPVQVPTSVVSQLPTLTNITPLPPITGNNINFPPTNIYDPNLPSLSGLPPLPMPPPGSDPHNAATQAAMAAIVANQFPQLDLQGAQDRIRQFSTNRNTHFRNSFTSPPSKIGEPDPTKLHVIHIPEHLNNITKLNEHFSKFGPIINIQVQIDKASASVEFSTEDACNAALNSPEPVLNNRFIQIRQFINRSSFHNTRGNFRGRVARNRPPVSVHERLGNKSEIIHEIIESKESIALKQKSQDRIKAARDAQKSFQAQQLESAKRAKQTLLQQQKELLEKQITQQKRLVEKLQDPNTQMTEKGSLLQTLKALASNTDEMRTRVKTLETEIEDDKERTKVEKEVEELEKLLLSMSASGQDTQQIRLNLYRLQDKAHRLGIYSRKRKLSAQHERGRGRGRGGRGRGRGMALSQKMAQKSNEYMAAGAIVDRRPRKLRVSGYADHELNDVIVHLADIGEVEYLETIEDDICIVVQYKTRADAELAATRGQFLKNKKLIVVWQKSNEDSDFSQHITNAENDIKEIEEELAKELGQNNITYEDTPPRRHKSKKHKKSESQNSQTSENVNFHVEINLPIKNETVSVEEKAEEKIDFKPSSKDDDLLNDDNDSMNDNVDTELSKTNGFPVIKKSTENVEPSEQLTEIVIENNDQIIPSENVEAMEPPIKKSRGDSDDDLLYSDEEENKTKAAVEPVKNVTERTTSDDLLLDEEI